MMLANRFSDILMGTADNTKCDDSGILAAKTKIQVSDYFADERWKPNDDSIILPFRSN